MLRSALSVDPFNSMTADLNLRPKSIQAKVGRKDTHLHNIKVYFIYYINSIY